MAANQKGKSQLLVVLKALRKLKPAYDDSHGLATFQYDMMADGPGKELPGGASPACDGWPETDWPGR